MLPCTLEKKKNSAIQIFFDLFFLSSLSPLLESLLLFLIPLFPLRIGKLMRKH